MHFYCGSHLKTGSWSDTISYSRWCPQGTFN